MTFDRFASLRALDLSGIPKLQDGRLSGLSRLQLTSISLAGCEHITGAGLRHVGLVKGLTALDLTGCCKVSVPALPGFALSQCIVTTWPVWQGLHRVGLPTGLTAFDLPSCKVSTHP